MTTADSARDRWLALYVLCVGFLMIVLDMTVVNVALPAIQEDLGFSQSGLAWVVNGYLIAFGGLLLLSGRLGDLLGRKDVFMYGMGIFLTASLVCGFAQSQEVLVGARFIQGVGGALTSAVILGMIVTMFQEPKEQAKALGVYAFVASAGGSIGLLAGGILTEAINWHWIFFINLPIGIGTALAANKLVTRDKGLGFDKGTDIPGAVLITSSLMLGVYTIVGPAAEDGWGNSTTLILGAISAALLALFIYRQAHAANPLMPLRMFRSRNVSGANVIQALTIAGMFGMFFMGSLYMQQVLGYDALEIGLAFLPTTLAMGIMSIRFSDRLINRFGPKNVLIPGLTLIGLGLALFTEHAGRRRLPGERPAADAPAWDRRGLVVHGADDARDVGRHAGGRGPRIGSRQHDRAGRRRARPRGPRDALRDPDRKPDRRRNERAGGARQRLPPRVLDRHRAGRRRDRGRRDRGRGARRGAQPRRGARGRRLARGRPARARVLGELEATR